MTVDNEIVRGRSIAQRSNYRRKLHYTRVSDMNCPLPNPIQTDVDRADRSSRKMVWASWPAAPCACPRPGRWSAGDGAISPGQISIDCLIYGDLLSEFRCIRDRRTSAAVGGRVRNKLIRRIFSSLHIFIYSKPRPLSINLPRLLFSHIFMSG